MAERSVTSYAVLRERGAHWDASLPMRQQERWEAHATFMDALAADGFVLLGGPLGKGEEQFLLIIAAGSEQAIENRLADDPWTSLQLLRTASVERWEILLGDRPGMTRSHQPVVYSVVTLEQGEHWDARFPMRKQQHWDEHARLMDAFVENGFILLGGPLEGERRVLLVINAESRQTIKDRFAADPWIATGVRRIANVERWEILLEASQDGSDR